MIIVAILAHLEDLDSGYRSAAYWALSKRHDGSLLAHFRSWLGHELGQEEPNGLFQLMIALDNLNEPVFAGDRTGYAYHEIELNRRDAKRYLTSFDREDTD